MVQHDRRGGEVGIVGFIAFLTILSRLAIEIIKIINLEKLDEIQKSFASGMIGSIPGILINAFFIDIFEASKFAIIFWLMIGILIAIIRIPNKSGIIYNE